MEASVKASARQRALDALLALAPPGGPPPADPAVLARARELTKELVAAYGEWLNEDPFEGVYEREVPVLDGVDGALAGRTVLVTGGEGFVGATLIRRLTELPVKRIISIDNARGSDGRQARVLQGRAVPVIRYCADVRDRNAVARVYDRERPSLVFHLAAQRLPGMAEVFVRETLSTNLRGTRNVVGLSSDYGIAGCVVASTGKASHLMPTDIYAGSKKLVEWWLSTSQAAGVARAAVRFTHIAENSPVTSEIDQKIGDGILSLHSPDRFIHVQSVDEATGLLLNALVVEEAERVPLVAVEDPGWPVDVLRIALYELRRSGKDIPLYFAGLPRGYSRHAFPGQFVWSGRPLLNSMVNAIEAQWATFCGRMVITSPADVGATVVEDALGAIDEAIDGTSSEREVAATFATAVRAVAADSLQRVDPDVLSEILISGCDPRRVPDDEVLLEHRDLIRLILEAVDENRSSGGDRLEGAVTRARAIACRGGEADPEPAVSGRLRGERV